MTKSLKTLSTLAIAAATVAVTAIATSNMASAAGNPFRHPGHGPVVTSGSPFKLPPVYQRFGNHLNITCLACNLPRPKPSHPFPWRNPHWKYGQYHWHSWYRGPGIAVTGAPVVPVAATAQVAPVAAAAPAASPCSCLTKQNLPDGTVLFQDICTRESAIEAPASAR